MRIKFYIDVYPWMQADCATVFECTNRVPYEKLQNVKRYYFWLDVPVDEGEPLENPKLEAGE